MDRLFGLGPGDDGDRVRRADDTAVELDRLTLGHSIAQRRTTQLRRHYTQPPHPRRVSEFETETETGSRNRT